MCLAVFAVFAINAAVEAQAHQETAQSLEQVPANIDHLFILAWTVPC